MRVVFTIRASNRGFRLPLLYIKAAWFIFRVLHKITVLLTLADCIHFHRRVLKTRRNESRWFWKVEILWCDALRCFSGHLTRTMRGESFCGLVRGDWGEREREREFDRAMLLIASLQEASSSQGPFPPSSLSHCTKTCRRRKHSERIGACHAPAPWSQPNTDRRFSPSQRESCSVVTKPHRSISLIFAIKSCCLLRISVCLLLKFQTSYRFSEERFIALFTAQET